MARRTIYKKRKRFNAALLAFISGVIGLHKFYLRDRGAGIFYIILAIVTANSILSFPITGILGIFDAMKLLMMPDSEFDRKYNQHLLKQNRSYRQNSRSKVVQAKTRKRIKNNPFKKSGIKKYKEFYLEESIEDFKKALEIDVNDPEIHFNIACAYSLTEKKEEAFSHLSKAVALGFNDLKKIKSHDDLAYIRIQKEFKIFQESGYTNFSVSTKTIKQTKTKKAENELDQDILLSQLNKLKELRDKGILTENDYHVETKRLKRR